MAAVYAAYRHAEPVAPGFLHKPHRFVDLSKAHLFGEDLLIGDGLLAGLVAHHGAKLRLDGDARFVGQLGGLRVASILPARDSREASTIRD